MISAWRRKRCWLATEQAGMPAWLARDHQPSRPGSRGRSSSFCGSLPAADGPSVVTRRLAPDEVVQRGAGGRRGSSKPASPRSSSSPVSSLVDGSRFLRAGAGQIAAAETVDMRQAWWHLDHAHLFSPSSATTCGRGKISGGVESKSPQAWAISCASADSARRRPCRPGDAEQNDAACRPLARAAIRVSASLFGAAPAEMKAPCGSSGSVKTVFRRPQPANGVSQCHISVAPPE